MKSSSKENTHQTRKHWSELNNAWMSMKHSFWVSSIGVETKSEHKLHAALLRDKWNQVLTKPSLKSRNHCSELNNSWISIKQSVFASLRCGATKSQQILQTELCQGKWNQVLTKPSPKSRKHWSKPKHSWIPMKQTVFASLMHSETKYSWL